LWRRHRRLPGLRLTALALRQKWRLDATGNWSGFHLGYWAYPHFPLLSKKINELQFEKGDE
jgi:hypothetical protein